MINYQYSKKTVASKFKRLAYFNGQLLTENDLLEEQEYIREKLKMHNRFHGTGVIEGLEVTTDMNTSPTMENSVLVTINPGYALDCEGNEVIVCKPYKYDIKDSIEYFKRIGAYFSDTKCTPEECNQEDPHITIGLIYGECNSNPSTQYMTTCTDFQDQYSRTREGFMVAVKLECKNAVNFCKEKNAIDICSPSSGCNGTEMDYNENMIIPLARICISDSAVLPILNVIDIRQYAWTFNNQSIWEQARKQLIRPDIKVVHDISGIVNMDIDSARRILAQQNMIVNQKTLVSSELTQEKRAKIKSMSPLVPEGSKIILITYEDRKKVRFGITSENASDQD